nr:hypothetical protein [Propionibacterium sp.]
MEFGGPSRRTLYAVVVSALVVSLFFGWYVTFGPGAWASHEPSAMQAAANRTAARTAGPGATMTSALAPPVASPSRGVVSDGTATGPSEEQAVALLEAEHVTGPALARLEGQWVAQLASKYVGIVDPQQVTSSGEHRFTARDIYAEHAALEARVTGAKVLLLDSRTFGNRRSFEGEPYWVTVAVDPSFGSADTIVAWCAKQFPELSGTALNNQCLPTQLTGMATP